MEHSLALTRAILIDLDGTIYQSDGAVPGAREFVNELRTRGYPLRFVTNTTSRCRATLAAKLAGLGIGAETRDIFGPPYAAAQYLRDRGVGRAHLLVREDARQEFEMIAHADEDVEYVVVGDLGDAWTFGRLNKAFRLLMAGAELIALGMNRYWRGSDGLLLDAGPFTAALEFATGKEALVLGKPAAAFFHLAVNDLGMLSKQVAMIGDGIDTDVGGAQGAGLVGILVRTGKFRPDDLNGSIEPQLIVDSLTDLIPLLKPRADRSCCRPA